MRPRIPFPLVEPAQARLQVSSARSLPPGNRARLSGEDFDEKISDINVLNDLEMSSRFLLTAMEYACINADTFLKFQ